MSSAIKVLCVFLCIIYNVSHKWTWLNATLSFWTHLWLLIFCYLALQSYCQGANESRTMFCGPVRLFSAVSQITKRHTNTTRFWRQEGIYAPPLNILSVSSSLLSCRSKGQAGRKLREQTTTTASQLYSKSPVRHRSETQGQQCAHGPCSHPLWKRCLSPVPRNISKRKRSQLYEGWQSIVCGCDSCEAAWTVW